MAKTNFNNGNYQEAIDISDAIIRKLSRFLDKCKEGQEKKYFDSNMEVSAHGLLSSINGFCARVYVAQGLYEKANPYFEKAKNETSGFNSKRAIEIQLEWLKVCLQYKQWRRVQVLCSALLQCVNLETGIKKRLDHCVYYSLARFAEVKYKQSKSDSDLNDLRVNLQKVVENDYMDEQDVELLDACRMLVIYADDEEQTSQTIQQWDKKIPDGRRDLRVIYLSTVCEYYYKIEDNEKAAEMYNELKPEEIDAGLKKIAFDFIQMDEVYRADVIDDYFADPLRTAIEPAVAIRYLENCIKYGIEHIKFNEVFVKIFVRCRLQGLINYIESYSINSLNFSLLVSLQLYQWQDLIDCIVQSLSSLMGDEQSNAGHDIDPPPPLVYQCKNMLAQNTKKYVSILEWCRAGIQLASFFQQDRTSTSNLQLPDLSTPAPFELLYLYAIVLCKNQQYQAAIIYFETAELTCGVKGIYYYYLWALAHYQLLQYDKALQVFRNADEAMVDEEPIISQYKYLRGLVLMKQGFYETAALEFVVALEQINSYGRALNIYEQLAFCNWRLINLAVLDISERIKPNEEQMKRSIARFYAFHAKQWLPNNENNENQATLASFFSTNNRADKFNLKLPLFEQLPQLRKKLGDAIKSEVSESNRQKKSVNELQVFILKELLYGIGLDMKWSFTQLELQSVGSLNMRPSIISAMLVELQHFDQFGYSELPLILIFAQASALKFSTLMGLDHAAAISSKIDFDEKLSQLAKYLIAKIENQLAQPKLNWNLLVSLYQLLRASSGPRSIFYLKIFAELEASYQDNSIDIDTDVRNKSFMKNEKSSVSSENLGIYHYSWFAYVQLFLQRCDEQLFDVNFLFSLYEAISQAPREPKKNSDLSASATALTSSSTLALCSSTAVTSTSSTGVASNTSACKL